MHTSFSDIFKTEEIVDDGVRFTIPENWMQGRTTYGGLSAALCLHTVQVSLEGLPPLRGANVVFTGPVGGEVTVSCKPLRQGKSVSYIEANIIGEAGHAAQVVFCFGRARESKFDNTFVKPPEVPAPQQSVDFFSGPFTPVAFAHNFDILIAKGDLPVSSSKEHEHIYWIRHKDKQANDLRALLAIADTPPPAVFPMFETPTPISTMNWLVNIVEENPSTEDGWWLMRMTAEHARDGYTSQDMQVWNSSGQLVATGRQNVAIFY